MTDLDIAPPQLRALTSGEEWSPSEQEPDLEIVLRSRRTVDSNGTPCSRWEYGYAVEGEWKGPLSQIQRDYAGAFMRHISRLIQEPTNEAVSLEANVAAIARRFQAELRATMAIYANLAEYLVRTEGLHGAASILGMKEYKVKHLLRSRHKQVSVPGELAELHS